MARSASIEVEKPYRQVLQTLSEGSVARSFDPYLDIDWDSPEFAIDPHDPRWVLSSVSDPLGATQWYQDQSLERRIAMGMWRQANVTKVGSAFESILIRGMLQYIMALPNQSPEFRYCLHEMTEECNHIQMFQELVNRMDIDVPGMRPMFRRLSPIIGVLGAKFPVIFFIGILAGEEPIDHFQKDLIREGKDTPPAMLRTMEIHIAEEARHISFAHEFLRNHVPRLSRSSRAITSVAFPGTMRWLAGEIMSPPKEFAEEFGIPDEVMKSAFWGSPHSRRILGNYFGEMRALADELGLMNPVSKRAWRKLRIDGDYARYRGEPKRSDKTRI
ncbi:AurF N-oxygenase family protein [Rhodococcus erythropolis]|uniref:AurF N-oxygenase family protein n=1 Tax=Rhodococcus erythropolis TaxID=1833 RepID=UPI000492A99F|nr:diiron oxygenase [Rhodococcus erythropolis]ALU70429.1 membrane protein [Rhodococcus erythropolis R138]MCW2295987.1 hypothetical protein [Rhodococcus erythropolis]